jgi:transglutaminase-like putative cysteine protease
VFTARTQFDACMRDRLPCIDVEIGCTFEFETPRPTHAIVMVEPHFSEAANVIEQRFELEPTSPTSVYHDHFGNTCRRIDLAEGKVRLTFDALVSTPADPDPEFWDAAEAAPGDLPDDALKFLLPSRFCESDVLADEAFRLFGGVQPGWPRVQAVSDWANGHLGFQYGSSSPSYSARDVFSQGLGVCRDFAHLAITMCRALNIPARYVFGYLPDIGVPDPGTPMDFCAWMEVFLGDGWHTFDPRNNQRRIGRTVIGRGRDAADVAMVTSFGAVQLHSMLVRAKQPGIDPS